MTQRRLLLAAAAAVTLLQVGCGTDKEALRIGPVPEGRNGRLKQFKAAANYQIGRMDITFVNLQNYSDMVPNANTPARVKDTLRTLQRCHDNLVELMKTADEVHATVEGEAVRKAFFFFFSTIREVTDRPMGEINEERINMMVIKAGYLEEVVD